MSRQAHLGGIPYANHSIYLSEGIYIKICINTFFLTHPYAPYRAIFGYPNNVTCPFQPRYRLTDMTCAERKIAVTHLKRSDCYVVPFTLPATGVVLRQAVSRTLAVLI